MMKFNREDLGLYFATSLVGAGTGLLLGALIASRIQAVRMARDMSYLEEDWEAPDIHMETYDDEFVVETEEQVSKAKVEKKEKKREFKLSKNDRTRLLALIDKYSPTPMQVSMVEGGVMSIDDLEVSLIEEEFDEFMANEEDDDEELILAVEEVDESEGLEPTDYNGQYRAYVDDKPEMDALLLDDEEDWPPDAEKLLVVIDDRWEVCAVPPEGKHAKNKRLVHFNPITEETFTLTRQGTAVPANIASMMSQSVRDHLWNFLLYPTFDEIYVDDTTGTRWYHIIRAEDESKEEDSRRNARPR